MTRGPLIMAGIALLVMSAAASVRADEAALPIAERVKRAETAIGSMKDTLAAARTRLDGAKADKDLVEVNCINGALAAIKGLLTLSEQARVSLDEALSVGDPELTDHQLSRIKLAGSRVQGFRVQVEACVGEAGRYTGQTAIDLAVDPEQRSDDPSRSTSKPTFTAVNIGRPPAVSGSQ